MADPSSCQIPDYSYAFESSSMSAPEPGDSATWVWCKCTTPDIYDDCSRSAGSYDSSHCTADCQGDGWFLLCGDATYIPGRNGDFAGDVAVVCTCPTLSGSSSAELWYNPDEEFCSSAPLGPFPFDFTDKFTYVAPAVTAAIFNADCSDNMSSWTWCECNASTTLLSLASSLSSSSSMSLCPFTSSSQSMSEGGWVLRSGCADIGPPPVPGRYPGETVFMGDCCLVSNSSSSYSHNPCNDAPAFPVFDYTFDEEDSGGTAFPACTDDCEMWMWCPATADYWTNCPEQYGNGCGGASNSLGDVSGHWVRPDNPRTFDTPLTQPPCTVGRFFGEIVWKCSCATNCSPGALIVGGGLTPSEAEGVYNLQGWFEGMPYYQGTGNWYIYYRDGSPNGEWYLALLDAPPAPGQEPPHANWFSAVPQYDFPMGQTLTGYQGASGTPVIACCDECGIPGGCENCDTLTVSISGLTGACGTALNGDHALTRYGSDSSCYFSWTLPGGGPCASGAIMLTCNCNAWTLAMLLNSCDEGGGSIADAVWASTPKAPELDGCPPSGAYTLHAQSPCECLVCEATVSIAKS